MSNTAPANAAPRCQHVYTDNARCSAPALRNYSFCHWHQIGRDSRKKDNFPILEDANSVQLALSQVMAKLMANEITPYHASVAFYGLQIAFQVQEKIIIKIDPKIVVTELTPALEAERNAENESRSPSSDANAARNGSRSPSNDTPISIPAQSQVILSAREASAKDPCISADSTTDSPSSNDPMTQSPDGPIDLDHPMKKPPAFSHIHPDDLNHAEVRYASKHLLMEHHDDNVIRSFLDTMREANPEGYSQMIETARQLIAERGTDWLEIEDAS